MKKDYLRPESILVNISIENAILGGSDIIGVDPNNPSISAADKKRGEWGDIWGK